MLSEGDLHRLGRAYQHDSSVWEAAPRPAPVRQRLHRAALALAAAAEAVADLERHDLTLAGLNRHEAARIVDELTGLAAGAGGAVADLDRRGAGRGGARRLPALFEPPPKAKLLLAVRSALAAGNHPTDDRSVLLTAGMVLRDCSDTANGLADVLKRLGRNQAKSSPVPPDYDAVRYCQDTAGVAYS